MSKRFILLAYLTFFTGSAIGDVCDYLPSKYIGKSLSSAASVSTGAIATIGSWMNTAGFYTLTHSTSGLVMLGSTSVGTTAAGTTGIIAGTAGTIGTASAAMMSPFLIIPTAIAAVSIAAYEGGCYLTEN